MSFLKIWIHAIWTTKNRKPLLTKEMRPALFEHIHHNAREKDILIDLVNGHIDHIHCLFLLKSDQTVAKVMQLMKGEAAFWCTKEKILTHKLEWQNDYYAISVSESALNSTRLYILKQEAHHTKKSFSEEHKEFMKQYGFK